MHLHLKREFLNHECTIGTLSVDGEFFCYTLEDIEREIKVHGKTAIPRGTYKGIVNMSNRFRKLMPLLLDVPGFAGIRIHTGNTAADTEGCILVGYEKKENMIFRSRPAFFDLMLKLKGESFTITIE